MVESKNMHINITFNREGIFSALSEVVSKYDLEKEGLSVEEKLDISTSALEGHIGIKGDGITEAECSCILKKVKSVVFYETAYRLDASQIEKSLKDMLFPSSKNEDSVCSKISRDINAWYEYVKSIKSKRTDAEFSAIGDYLELDMHYASLHYTSAVWDHLKEIDAFYMCFRSDVESLYTLDDMFTEKSKKSYIVDHGLKFIYENKKKIQEAASQIKKTEKAKGITEQARRSMVSQLIAPENIKLIRSVYKHKEKIFKIQSVLWCVSDLIENVWCLSNIIMVKHKNHRKKSTSGVRRGIMNLPVAFIRSIFRGLVHFKNIFARINKKGVYYLSKAEELEEVLEEEKTCLERLNKIQEVKQKELAAVKASAASLSAKDSRLDSLNAEKESIEETIKEIRLKVIISKGWIEQIQEDIHSMEACREKSIRLNSKILENMLGLTLNQKKYIISHIDKYTKSYGCHLNLYSTLAPIYPVTFMYYPTNMRTSRHFCFSNTPYLPTSIGPCQMDQHSR